MATRRFGANFLSVGRVQSPTLGLIVERELERRAHVPEPFWEVSATFAHPDGSFVAEHTTDKFWKEEEAKAAVANTNDPGTVKEITARKNTPQAADPAQHHRLHHRRLQPARDHPLARDADRRGPLHGRLHLLPAHRQHRLPALARHARADRASWSRSTSSRPRASCSSRTARPPPGARRRPPTTRRSTRPPRSTRSASRRAPRQHRRVYELVARRFLATFSPPMITEGTRANITARPSERLMSRPGDLLRARLRRDRPRLRRDLHLRALGRHRDPEARGGPGAGARGSRDRGQGDAAAAAHQPGQADRADGGARPRHQGDARRHHPEALRPRLRVRQPAGALGDRDRDVPGPSSSSCRGWRPRR